MGWLRIPGMECDERSRRWSSSFRLVSTRLNAGKDTETTGGRNDQRPRGYRKRKRARRRRERPIRAGIWHGTGILYPSV